MKAKTMDTYCIIDTHTGDTVAHGLTRNGARRSADARDNAYGAYRYIVQLENVGRAGMVLAAAQAQQGSN